MPKSILIADNNAFYRQVLGDFFRDEGYDVSIAADGVEALERITAGGVDVLLLDLIMPRIDGARLCSFLKSHPEYSSIPIVILSGILADEIDGIERIRADAYVAKMPMDRLQPTLRRVFDSLEGGGTDEPVVVGFDKMHRREVVVEFLEERRVRDTIQNELAEGIVELNDDGRILRTNRAFEELVGRTAEQLLSQPIADLLGESRDALAVLFRDAQKSRNGPSTALIGYGGRTLRLRLHALHVKGAVARKIRNVLDRAAEENHKVRLATPEMFPGSVLLVQDITEEVTAQRERDRFRESMARSANMSALGHFVSGAAHELNNPLTGVLGYAQLLAEWELPADVTAALAKIEAGASRCKAIVDNLLIFSRRSESQREPESMNELALSAVEECRARPSAEGLEIRTDFAEALPRVHVNGPEILQALTALIENAALAAREGTAPPRVVVSTSGEEGGVLVEVMDSGRGIPPAILPKIFDPFFTTREVGRGRGLGLSVASGIAQAHGGRITARNLPREGACVAFTIPSVTAAARMAGGSAARAEESGERARILVVDDEPVVLELLSDLLGEAHAVETAANGREGLAKAEEVAYDVIFLDIRMPDMTGRQVYEALLATRPALADRVVFTTGDTVQEETRNFIDVVGQPCLAKPFSIDTITEIVERMLAASQAR